MGARMFMGTIWLEGVMKKLTLLTCAAFFALTGAAWAEFQKLDSQRDFVSVVEGKTLTRPLVELRVTESGGISGTGAVWGVSGQWKKKRAESRQREEQRNFNKNSGIPSSVT